MALIARIFVVFFSLMAACLAAAFAFAAALLVPEWQGFSSPEMRHGVLSVMVGFSAIFIGAYALLPAAVVIALAEAFRLRSAIFYGFAGGSIAVLVFTGLGMADFVVLSRDGPGLEIVAAAGIVGGLVYWLLAGRSAGRWHEPALPPAST